MFSGYSGLLYNEDGLSIQEIRSGGTTYIVAKVDLDKLEIKFLRNDPNDVVFDSFGSITQSLDALGEQVLFATNGGIFTEAFEPNGLYIENNIDYFELNPNEGSGNFFLKPNGVFEVSPSGVNIVSTEQFIEQDSSPEFAIQSGPMLLVDGAIHPAFRKESTNLFTRSSVGIMDSKTAYFVLSQERVNFYSFADFFLTELGCKNALFLDGSISQFYWDSSPEPETRKYGSYIVVTKGKR